MLILTIRTDKPESEIGLYNDEEQLGYETWQAHKQLAETIHLKIKQLLEQQSLGTADIQSIVMYKGPGSFTGLRIGASVAQALAYSVQVPIVSAAGNNWRAEGVRRLQQGDNEKIIQLDYGSPVHTTPQKK